ASGAGGGSLVCVVVSGPWPDGLAAIPDADGIELVDEGLRIVKDFDEPLRLHRLVIRDAAADPRRLRTIAPPSNLPGYVTSLVGRDEEIRLVGEALAASRIVTLTGPGGSGKTRLALGAARAV